MFISPVKFYSPLDLSSSSIPSGGYAIQTTSASTIKLATNLTSSKFIGVALNSATPGNSVNYQTTGPIDPTIFNLGAGLATAVGTNSSAGLVRVTDSTCTSGTNYVGYCDANGTVIVSPRLEGRINVVDFGADRTGTALCDTSFATALSRASAGQTIYLPAGTYRIANTWGPFIPGVSVVGDGGGQPYTESYPFVGSVIQYEGLADAIRIGSTLTFNAGMYSSFKNFVIRGINPLNRAPTRLLASQVVGGAVTSVVNNGGLCKVGMTAPHGLLTGQQVLIKDINGTTEANGAWVVTVNDGYNFTITGSLSPGVFPTASESQPVPTFTHTFTSSPSSSVTYVCGGGIVATGVGEFTLDNLYIAGFATGIVLDGSEVVNISNCNIVDPPFSLGGDVKRMSAGIWMTDADWGKRGFFSGTSTNVQLFDNNTFSGMRIGMWVQGGATTTVRGSEIEARSAFLQPDGYNHYQTPQIDAVYDNGFGLIRVRTTTHHAIDSGQQYPSDPLYVGIRGVKGVTAANGEFVGSIIDGYHFDIINTVGPDGTISAPPSFSGSYTSGGEISSFGISCQALMGRPINISFDTCYGEGPFDAHYLFSSPQLDVSAATLVTIRNSVCAGGDYSPFTPPALPNTSTPFIWIDNINSPFSGNTASFSVQCLRLENNFFASGACRGASGISTAFYSTCNFFTGGSGQDMYEVEPSATKGFNSDHNNGGGLSGKDTFFSGLSGKPTAAWDIEVQDNTISQLRIRDNQVAKYLDFWINGTHSTDFERSIQSNGAGDKSGTNDSLRSATLPQYVSGPSTLLGSSAIVPPHSCGYFEIFVQAHQDDDGYNTSAFWKWGGGIEQQGAGSLWITSGPTLISSFVGASGSYDTPVIGVSGSTMTVSANGSNNYQATYTVRFEINKAQRAR